MSKKKPGPDLPKEIFSHFMKYATESFSLYDSNLNLVEINEAGVRMFPPGITKKDLLGKNFMELVPDVKEERYIRYIRVLETGKPVIRDFVLPKKFGNITHMSLKAFKVNNYLGLIARDISKYKQAEKDLRKNERELRQHRNQLERLVKERTQNLEEVNSALRVLLNKREEDKSELEEKIMFNVKELVLPYLETLKNSSLDDRQKKFLNIIESNLNDIVSPFIRGISSHFLKLTPAEIQVANLVKQGKTSKDIAQLLHMSSRTIDAHRYNIRKKIGLKSKKENLRTYLMSLQ